MGDADCANAMAEPRTASDLQSTNTFERVDGHYNILNGSKSLISNERWPIWDSSSPEPTPHRVPKVPGAKCIAMMVVGTEKRTGLRRAS